MSNIDRVLLVDDEPMLLGPLRRLVQRVQPDALVVYAADASMAEWQIRSTPIRLVVTDLRMNGDEFAGMRVVAAARKAGVGVAVLTGAGDDVMLRLSRDGVTVVSKHGSIAKALTEIVGDAFAA